MIKMVMYVDYDLATMIVGEVIMINGGYDDADYNMMRRRRMRMMMMMIIM